MAATKNKINKKLSDHPRPLLYIISLVLLILTAVLFGLLRDKLPPEVPLYYGKPPGAKQIAAKNFLLLPLALSLTLSALNYAIANFLKDNYLRSILAVLSLFLSLISVIAVLKIIFLVGNL